MPLLCRVAENMFWLNRYVERAIATIRVVDVTAHLELDAGDADAQQIDFWTPLLGPRQLRRRSRRRRQDAHEPAARSTFATSSPSTATIRAR